jgi:hypothetical protein
MPAAIRRPPPTCRAVIDSDRISSAKIAPRNGCRFAYSEARDGPTCSIELN